jgi:hypothetical protein
MTTYRTAHGTLDPNNHLAAGDIEEWTYSGVLDATKVDDINDAIEAWAERDPDGYSDYEARMLENEVYRIMDRLPAHK